MAQEIDKYLISGACLLPSGLFDITSSKIDVYWWVILRVRLTAAAGEG